MRQIAMVVAVLGLAPLLLGAGGANPGIPFPTRIAGSTYTIAVVLDPHVRADETLSGQDVTTRAKQATVRIFRDNRTAGALFDLPTFGFPLYRGCDLSLTETRFLDVLLEVWIPPAVLSNLFEQLGETVSPVYAPVITRILNATCTDDPDNPGPIPDGGDGAASEPGMLSFNALVRFKVVVPN